jgi:Mlc titration factor MtfA (ptsG expression regulator)
MGFLREWRRKRTLKSARLDEALWTRVAAKLSFLRGLSEEDTARLKQLVVLFLAEKEMHGAHGLQLTDEVRLSIAAQACLPILNLGLDVYEGWVGVIVYPGEFRVHKEEVDEDGVVHSFADELAGEAWPGGPVILSWEDVGMAERGYNVVIHEFAHKIHMDGGATRITPRRGAAWTRRNGARPSRKPLTVSAPKSTRANRPSSTLTPPSTPRNSSP